VYTPAAVCVLLTALPSPVTSSIEILYWLFVLASR
jgi:hypothetical protein